MLESEGLQTRPLQKIQMLGDNKPTLVFIDTAPAQRNPTTTLVEQKYVNSILRSVCISLHHEIL